MKKSLILLSIVLGLQGSIASSSALPIHSDLSPEMTAAVSAPLSNFWLQTPQTIEDWEQIQKGYVASATPNNLKLAKSLGVQIFEEKMNGVPVFILQPKHIKKNAENKVILYFHGGGYVLGHGRSGLGEALLMAGLEGYKLVCVDYRMAPQHPFPAAIDDALTVYKALLAQYSPQDIAVFGTSTGGGMALILPIQAHQNKLPMPAAIIAGTPWSELGKKGDSYFVNNKVDNILGTYDGMIDAAAKAYANGHDYQSPLLSPVNASNETLKAFPPTLLISGTRDLFLSNTVRMHRNLLKNKVPADLIIYEGLSHAQYYLVPKAPETKEHYEFMANFLDKVWRAKH